MTEFLAVYNDFDELLPEKLDRKDRSIIEPGKYFRIVIVFIENSKNEFLIQKVVPSKGDCFATTGGHVQYGVSSLDTIVSEVEEELGVSISKQEFTLLFTNKLSKVYQDVYYLKKDIDIKDIKLQKEEVEYVKWLTKEEINELIEKDGFRKGNIGAFKSLTE